MKLFLLFLGFIFMVVGLSYSILYINLFSFDYSVVEYFSYIFKRWECLLFIVGLLLTIINIFKKESVHAKRI